jgi:UPF0755 protein
VNRIYYFFRDFFRGHRYIAIATVALCIVIIAVCWIYIGYIRPPSLFPRASVIAVPQGESLSAVGDMLEQQNVIRSKSWFVNAVLFFGGEHQLIQGDYYFPRAENSVTIAWRMTHGDYKTNQTRTTIPEGSTLVQISLLVKKEYPDFDAVHFLTIASGKEGYLFPDTYYFGASTSPEEVLATMDNTFYQKMSDPQTAAAIKNFGHPLADIITMASILEHESYDTKDQQIIAGILWKRLALGMPLDLDSTLYYITGRDSARLTKADLRLNSLYNTYTHKGLPPGPIGNPGIDAIMAAVTPIQTKYLYFLNDASGAMHYSITLAQQDANESLYLN